MCLLFGPAERFGDAFWRPRMAWRVPWVGAGARLFWRSSGERCGARCSWLGARCSWLGAQLCSWNAEHGRAARAAAGRAGTRSRLMSRGGLAAPHGMCVGVGGSLPQGTQRLATASCVLSSHLGCQMCSVVGQDRCVLWHMSQPGWAPLLSGPAWPGGVWGGVVYTRAVREGIAPHWPQGWVPLHALPLDLHQGLSSSERTVYFFTEARVRASSWRRCRHDGL